MEANGEQNGNISSGYVYINDLPPPKMPTSFYVRPMIPMNFACPPFQVRSDMSIMSDNMMYMKQNGKTEPSLTESPTIASHSNPNFISSSNSFANVNVTSSDSTFTINTNVSSLPNVISQTTSTSISQMSVVSNTSQSSGAPIFQQPNPFGPNRSDTSVSSSTNFNLPLFNRPPPVIGNNSPVSIGARSNPTINVPPPTSIPPSVLPQASRIPSLLDIQVAPPTSIFKRTASSDPTVVKKARHSTEEDDDDKKSLVEDNGEQS